MAKVLVVDDDPQLLRMLGMILERGTHLPLLEDNPLNALQRIREEKPGLVVLDVMMPELSGHELCAHIRSSDDVAGVPILILTARSQSVDREAALASGADAYLSKPVMPGDLIETIDRLLAREEMVVDDEGDGSMVISFFGLRGGVGRTTLATNLSAALRRISRQEVCLVDLSPSGGQAVLHLRLQTRASWNDLPPLSQLDWAALKERLLVHQSGLRVLAAPRQPQVPIAPSTELIDAVLSILRHTMRFVVVDLPPMMSPAVQSALGQSDVMFHVLTPEVVSVQIARHTAQSLSRWERQPREKAYVLNQVTQKAQLAREAIENGLRAPLAFEIGYDPNQQRALMQGAPLALIPSTSPLSEVSRRLAEVILHRALENGKDGRGVEAEGEQAQESP
ncbi:MAG TPA: response regulator [Candidatus Binatia bacterium]|nr:response regulator [Candidatus Binatia bacterium]